MERSLERLSVARKALQTLQELPLGDSPSDVIRDAAIQRFEYTFEAAWKAAQQYLRDQEGLVTASPKSAIRESFHSGLLTEEQARAAMLMADDRNLTAHTYNELLAVAIYSRISTHASVIETWLQAMEKGLGRETL
jgi:nucleotidyltransferase substrate binding protein (TIGR01987 family)